MAGQGAQRRRRIRHLYRTAAVRQSTSHIAQTAANADRDTSRYSAKNDECMRGCVCLVTGATRGVGKGIALELAKAGAIVYFTGTSSSSISRTTATTTDSYMTNDQVGGPGTLEQTEAEIAELGGVGIGIFCNHSNDEQVKAVFRRIEAEQGRLDLLVNNAFRIPTDKENNSVLFGNFWDMGVEAWDTLHTIGLRSHYVATCYAVPLMLRNHPPTLGTMKRPLIAMISSFGGLCYTFNVAYGVGKAGVDRMAKDMANDLRPFRIAVTSFYPGVVMTERMERLVRSGEWDTQVGIPMTHVETPAFTGRAIIAVATEAKDTNKSGTFQVVAELAQEYGFTDGDGRQPPSIRSLKFLLPAYGMDEATRKVVPDWMIPDIKLPFWIMANGALPVKEN